MSAPQLLMSIYETNWPKLPSAEKGERARDSSFFYLSQMTARLLKFLQSKLSINNSEGNTRIAHLKCLSILREHSIALRLYFATFQYDQVISTNYYGMTQ